MKVDVTEEDIREGRRKSPGSCPTARAITRAVKSSVLVGGITWGILGTVKNYPLPKEVSQWIREYDMGRKVEPISFEIEYESRTS